MKKIFFTLFIVLLIKNNLSAQTFTLNSNFEVYEIVYVEPVIFTSIQNVHISGDIESKVSISVIPNPDFSILIKDYGPSNIDRGSKGTIFRSKPGVTGGGKTEELKSKNDVVINQAYNVLNIVSNNSSIIGYTIYDILGNAILSEKIPVTNNYNIDASELKKAIYILKVDIENQEYKTIKFIKN